MHYLRHTHTHHALGPCTRFVIIYCMFRLLQTQIHTHTHKLSNKQSNKQSHKQSFQGPTPYDLDAGPRFGLGCALRACLCPLARAGGSGSPVLASLLLRRACVCLLLAARVCLRSVRGFVGRGGRASYDVHGAVRCSSCSLCVCFLIYFVFVC